MIQPLPIALAEGTFVAHFSERGLCGLDWPKRTEGASGAVSGLESAKLREWFRQTKGALERVLAGGTAETLPPLDLSSGTAFQREVWKELLRIPAGETRSYGELARMIGRPRAARAVGGACGANPIPLLIPCHRVVAAGGGMGGFSGPKAWKKRLLEVEAKARAAG